MNAPKRPPLHYDAVGGVALPLERAAGWLLDSLAGAVTTFPHWLIDESGVAVTLRLIAHEAEMHAKISWSTGDATGTLSAAPDPSGWLVVMAETNGAEVFRAYIDRPYEEYELWPADSGAPEGAEAPGRASKRVFWVSLNADAWPSLEPLAGGGGWVNISIDESRRGSR